MDVVIVGAGGHGKVVLDIIRAANEHRPIGFLDADPSLVSTTVGGLPVLGNINHFSKLRTQKKVAAAIVAIGDNRTRKQYASHLLGVDATLINAVHPTAIVSPSAAIGVNVVIAPRAVVGAEARIGDSVILNTACVVDHECRIGEASHICPMVALAGRVRVGACSFIGIGASVIPCLTIGEHSVIGAGATVIEDIPSHATAVGVPARVIRRSMPVDESLLATI